MGDMADVSTGSWVGRPTTPAPVETPEQREARRAAARQGIQTPVVTTPTGSAGSSGLTPEQQTQRQQQTGVDAGGTGYVSGQTMPNPNNGALAALGGATGGEHGDRPPPQGGGTQDRSEVFVGTPGVHDPRFPAGSQPNVYTPAGDHDPRYPAGNQPSSQASGGGDTTTVSSALTNPISSPAANGDPGKSDPNTGTYTKPALITTGNPAVDRLIDPGGLFTGPSFGDVGPATASQRAAFGLSDQFGNERYEYRPGAAAAQDVVDLEKANQEAIRQRQLAALDALTGAANGTVPSAAELQMRREAGRNVAATLGQARALGGRSAGGAARAGTMATADILARNNIEGAQLRAAEQDRNRQALTTALGGVRGQDVDVAAREAQLRQDAYANNLRSQLEQNDLAEKHRQELIEAQLKALGIGAGAGNAAVGAGAANAAAQNKYNGGILDIFGNAFS